MTLFYNTFEGGTDGTNITAANSGGISGTAWFTGGTTGNAWVYSAASARQGSMGALRTLDSNSGYLRGDHLSASGRGGMRRPFYVEAAPSARLTFGQVRSGTVLMASMDLNTDRTVILSDASGTIAGSSSPALTTSTWYWVELIVAPGATNTSGTIELGIWAADGTTLVHSYATTATRNIGTTSPATYYRFGGYNNALGFTYDKLDSCQWGDIASGWIGPYSSSNVPPTVTLSASPTGSVEPGTLVTLTATGTDTDGTIALYTWRQVSGPAVTLT